MKATSSLVRLFASLMLVGMTPAGIGAQCNTAPVALDDGATGLDEPILIDALANDSDAEGLALTVTVDGTTCAGSATVDFELVTLTPAPRLTADCTISYTATDEGGLSSSATIEVAIVAGIFADGVDKLMELVEKEGGTPGGALIGAAGTTECFGRIWLRRRKKWGWR